MARMPSLFVSHGSPMTAIQPSAARDFFLSFAQELPRPKAILIATAHFESAAPLLSTDEKPAMIYDFGGFPQPLFEIVYPAPGSPAVAERAAEALHAAGHDAYGVSDRGFDHGTWVPLSLMYPDADIPVVQISVQPELGAAHHMEIGRALAPLRDEGVLVIGSGSLTHNLYEVRFDAPDANAEACALAFVDWVRDTVARRDHASLQRVMALAPHAARAHPTAEHLWPLLVAAGAAGVDSVPQHIDGGVRYGVLSMDGFAWGVA
jgi:4,5-DOPA dioxygenase extradiol